MDPFIAAVRSRAWGWHIYSGGIKSAAAPPKEKWGKREGASAAEFSKRLFLRVRLERYRTLQPMPNI
jgi:hypothetical protein